MVEYIEDAEDGAVSDYFFKRYEEYRDKYEASQREIDSLKKQIAALKIGEIEG